MCILKKQPFVPESSAGDQIAFITERTGYLPIDFLDFQLPQFSYSFVDAIKTTSYVNLEYDTEFILEAARSVAAPLRTFSNDLTNKIRINNIDATIGIDIPDEIDVGIDQNGEIDISSQSSFIQFAAKNIINLVAYMSEHSDETISSHDFIGLTHHSLSKIDRSEHIALQTITQDFETLSNYSFSKEDAFIEELLENNTQKFAKLRAILLHEIEENKKDQVELETDILSFVQPISSDIRSYNSQFDIHNTRFKQAASELITGENKQATELQKTANKLVARVDVGMK